MIAAQLDLQIYLRSMCFVVLGITNDSNLL